MNELSEIFRNARNGDRITLENKIYEVAPEDGFYLKGFFFSNTAKQHENPDGERFCAIFLDEKSDITIDGNGAVVMLHGKMTPFLFCRCRNIVMKNIVFDHYRPTMSEFTVTVFGGKYAGVTTWGGVYSDGKTVYYASGSPAGAAMARFTVRPAVQHNNTPVC